MYKYSAIVVMLCVIHSVGAGSCSMKQLFSMALPPISINLFTMKYEFCNTNVELMQSLQNLADNLPLMYESLQIFRRITIYDLCDLRGFLQIYIVRSPCRL